MHKKVVSLCLFAALLFSLTLGLTGCSGSSKTEYCFGIVSDGNALSDDHLNQGAWDALREQADRYQFQYGYARSQSNDTSSFMAGVDYLVGEGANVIILPGVLFADTFLEACAKYPDINFIAIDCNPETVPQNGAAIVFDKSQAGFLAGYAAALELDDASFGGVFGKSDEAALELISGFMQGIEQAGGRSNAANFRFVDSRTSYPKGQQLAATLFEEGVTCLLTGSDPTGMGALAEARTRRQAGDDIWAVTSDANGHKTALYDHEQDLSASLTTAMCDYGYALTSLIEQLLEGEADIFGTTHIFDLGSGGIGLPEENPHLSEDTLKSVESAAEAIKNGEIVITVK